MGALCAEKGFTGRICRPGAANASRERFWDGHHLLQTSPLSTGNHSTRRLALCQELSGCGGSAQLLRSGVWIFPTRAYGAGSSSLVRRLPETCATRDPFPTASLALLDLGVTKSHSRPHVCGQSLLGIPSRPSIVIRGQRYWLWRAVDNEGEVLDFLVQSKLR